MTYTMSAVQAGSTRPSTARRHRRCTPGPATSTDASPTRSHSRNGTSKTATAITVEPKLSPASRLTGDRGARRPPDPARLDPRPSNHHEPHRAVCQRTHYSPVALARPGAATASAPQRRSTARPAATLRSTTGQATQQLARLDHDTEAFSRPNRGSRPVAMVQRHATNHRRADRPSRDRSRHRRARRGLAKSAASGQT